MSCKYEHIPVLLKECIQGLDIKSNGIYLDCTLGGGGHSREILLNGGKLIGIDKDKDAIMAADSALKATYGNYTLINDDFKKDIEILDKLNIDKIDGVLMDLGVSSHQINSAERGFSYMADAVLDMRMNQEQTLSAYQVVNEYPYEKLAKIIWEYGEDKLSRKIASRIVEKRAIKPIETTTELRELVERCYPPATRFKYGNPSKRTFQAIRIEVNGELDNLYEIIHKLTLRLKKGGRICAISFHSLEDRIVKKCFEYLNKDCICDSTSPICICDKVKEIALVAKKPITASDEELKNNKRAESAKLRIAEKL